MEFRVLTAERVDPVSKYKIVSPEASFALYVADGTFTTLAPGVVDGNGAPTNPLVADDQGQIVIGAPDGQYDVRVTHTVGGSKSYRNQSWADSVAAAAKADAALAAAQAAATQLEIETKPISGLGPYLLAKTPVGEVAVTLDGLDLGTASYTVAGKSVSLVGVDITGVQYVGFIYLKSLLEI